MNIEKLKIENLNVSGYNAPLRQGVASCEDWRCSPKLYALHLNKTSNVRRSEEGAFQRGSLERLGCIR